MRKYLSQLWIMLLLMLVSINSFAADPLWQVLPDNIEKGERDTRQYQAIKLPNDMTVLLVSDEKAVKSLTAVAIPVGALEDPDSQQGLAHYLEHMVLMGSTKYPQPGGMSEFLQKNGGSHNASTTTYRTAFYLEVENSAIGEAVDRLADALATPLLDPKNADRERNAVNAELTMARARDGMRFWQVRAETLNPAHPSSRFMGGNLETLSDKPDSKLQDELVKFYQTHYSGNLMNGVIYSNQSLDELAKLASKTFSRIPNKHAKLPVTDVPAMTEKEKGLMIHLVPALPQKTLQIEFGIDNNVADFRSKSDEYISYLIGNRSTGTLANWLQDQGLAESIGASSEPYIDRNQGSFTISVSLTDKGLEKKDKVIAAIFTYLNLIQNQGINKRYFNEIANVLDLSFRYGSIVRDMNYIEDISDMMLRYPIKNILNADYIADDYNADAINARLNEMTPENARIWVISPKEPSNKQAYFVNAPYQVDRITEKQKELWQALSDSIELSLPALNPYIPDNLSLIDADSKIKKPELLWQDKSARLFYMPSHYFSDEPKASVTLSLVNKNADVTVKQQVVQTLTDYLAGLSLSELSYQASVAGMNIASSSGQGIDFSMSGYTQHLPELVDATLKSYLSFESTEDELEQAKSWYREQLLVTHNLKAFETAMLPARRLNRIPYYEETDKLKALESITIKDIIDNRREVIEKSALQALIIGNLTPEQSRKIVQSAHQLLGNKGTEYWIGETLVFNKPDAVEFEAKSNSTDNALGELYIPIGYSRLQGQAISSVLASVIKPWFYDQLRTEEQLGYAVFSYPATMGEQSGLGFLLQSNAKPPVYLNQRYQAFYQQANERLKKLSEKEFNQYKQAIINEIKQPPQTFYEEVGLYGNDFNRNNEKYDSRKKILAELEKVTLKQAIEFYQHAVIKPTGFVFISQVIGKEGKDADYAQNKLWKRYNTVSELQKTLPVEEIKE
ncbi:pitrilysin [Proteus myxofaciens]|uniref:Protease 3 n=1 Tax=Proteus myxofaciens ATCC 19692 TaxID=1354337 RepID=A0A198GCN4_9GAMM|nr:pitrilysin [Proteus myxofaciens]OAT34549.1 protease III [Proteus myxofaciens ATCC 19692]